MAGGGSVDGRSPRIDLVPIIDAITGVIFFLILSSTFVEFTKITLPPAVTSIASALVAKDPPLSPKLIGLVKGQTIYLVLNWNGKQPDQVLMKVKRDTQNKRSEALQETTLKIVDEFKKKYPSEQTLQLGFSPQVTYQEMISTMDGARKIFNDLVMVSWTESQLIAAQVNEKL